MNLDPDIRADYRRTALQVGTRGKVVVPYADLLALLAAADEADRMRDDMERLGSLVFCHCEDDAHVVAIDDGDGGVYACPICKSEECKGILDRAMGGQDICIFCGYTTPRDIHGGDLKAHIEVCPEHPLVQARAEIERLREEGDYSYWEQAYASLDKEHGAALTRIQELEHRLFPGQGEEYANEVERQRTVIDTLMSAVDGYKNALRAVSEWDMLNPPQTDRIGDLGWLRGLMDEALKQDPRWTRDDDGTWRSV